MHEHGKREATKPPVFEPCKTSELARAKPIMAKTVLYYCQILYRVALLHADPQDCTLCITTNTLPLDAFLATDLFSGF